MSGETIREQFKAQNPQLVERVDLSGKIGAATLPSCNKSTCPDWAALKNGQVCPVPRCGSKKGTGL